MHIGVGRLNLYDPEPQAISPAVISPTGVRYAQKERQMTTQEEQERRERAAAHSRAYRARKRAEATERVRVTSDDEPGPMRQAVELSIAAARWLTGADAASCAQVRQLADIADHVDDVRLEMRAHSLLSRVLGEMGLTPRVRMQLELRARKLEAVAQDRAVDAQPNVTRISPRPTPRKR